MTIATEGRKLLRPEVRNSETPIERKPEWIRTKARTGPQYTELKSLVRSGGLHTVREEAGCPNIQLGVEPAAAVGLVTKSNLRPSERQHPVERWASPRSSCSTPTPPPRWGSPG